MRIGNRDFAIGKRTYVMGILNVTPDSFSDGGLWMERDVALRRVEQMLEEGMDILDVGGESTRPGHSMVPDWEEIERVIPIIEQIKERFDVPISLDTYKSKVAKAGIAAGVDMINDIWGLRYDGRMAQAVADSDVPICLMHNRNEAIYKDFVQEVLADLGESIELARSAGIADDRIILDPGVGFGKTFRQNLQILNNLEMLNMYGYPLLLGTSRKSVIGLALDQPVDGRVEGTVVTTVLGVMKGVSFVRVHDVKENVQAIRMIETILNS